MFQFLEEPLFYFGLLIKMDFFNSILSIFNLIPRSTCLVIVVIILIATIAFVGYYVFFVKNFT